MRRSGTRTTSTGRSGTATEQNDAVEGGGVAERTPAEAELPPGPGKHPMKLLGVGPTWIREDPTGVMEHLCDEYGPTFRVYNPVAGGESYVLGRPEQVQYVLNDAHDGFAKAEIYEDELGDVFGRGLVTSEGELWKRQRSLIAPMFTRDRVATFVDLMVEETREMIERWRDIADAGETIDLLEEMERVTLLTIGRAMFGADMAGKVDEMQWALDVLRGRFKRRTEYMVKVPDWMPTPLNLRDQRAFETLEDIVREIIESRDPADAAARVEGSDGGAGHDGTGQGGTSAGDADLLDMLLAAETSEGEGMDEDQVRDEVMTFLLAGHETTAASLTWTWYLLAHEPERYAALHDAVADVDLPTVDDDGTDAAGDGAADAMDVAAALEPVRPYVQEAMRIFPPVPLFARRATEEHAVDGYRVPEGANVVLPQIITHRDPAIWDEPWRYDPDRFRGDGIDDKPDYSYYPFGGGPRMCIGRMFSLVESQVILGLASRDLRLALESPTHPPQEMPVRTAVTMTPDTAIEMSVEEWG
jgi:cytochrome P450